MQSLLITTFNRAEGMFRDHTPDKHLEVTTANQIDACHFEKVTPDVITNHKKSKLQTQSLCLCSCLFLII